MRHETLPHRILFLAALVLAVGACRSGVLTAQSAGADLEELAGKVADPKRKDPERLDAWKQLMDTPDGAALERAFDALAGVRKNIARLERQKRNVDKRVAKGGKAYRELPEDSKLTADEWRAELRAEEVERIRIDLLTEEGTVILVRTGLRRRLWATPDESTIGKLVARVAGMDKPAARADALRTLGYFPSAAARTALFAHVSDNSTVVATGAVAGLAEQAGAWRKADGEDPLWTEAWAALRKMLTRAWRDRDAAHRAYLAQSQKHVKYLNKLGAQQNKQIKKLLRGAKPKNLPEAAIRKLNKLEAERKELADALRVQEDLIEALHDGLGGAFACLSAAERAKPEASMAGAIAKPTHKTASLRMVALGGRLHSGAIRAALEKATGARAPEARLAACDALGRHADAVAVPALAACLNDPFWQVRMAAIRALRATGGKEGVDALVAGLFEADGLVQHEMNAALAALTGKDFHTNAPLWRDWWQKNRAGYTGPPGDEEAAATHDPLAGPPPADPKAEAAKKPVAVSFYGIRTRSKRIIFVLDVSGSMHGDINKALPPGTILTRPTPIEDQKITHARREMRRTIVSLPPDAMFNIITYGDRVKAWKKDVVRATPENKDAAKKWVKKIQPEGQTNIFDALTRAFGMVGKGKRGRLQVGAADTIYLLTDGRANHGAVIDPTEMLEEVERLNEARKVTIHTVALGRDADASFMRRLAHRFGGRFVHLKGKKKDDDPFGR